MMQLEKTEIDERLACIDEEEKKYSELLKKSAEESAPKFGLA
jgi:hypothetical protein